MIFATLITEHCSPKGVSFSKEALEQIVSDLNTGKIPVLHQWSFHEKMGNVVSAELKNSEVCVKIDPVDPDYLLYPASYTMIGEGKTKDNKVQNFSISAVIRSSEGF